MTKYDKQIEEYESQALFDKDVKKVNMDYVKKVDENYVYLSNNFFMKIYNGIIRSLLFVLSPIFNYFYCKLKVKGRKNLKGIKGAMSVSNHVLTVDNLIVRQALRWHKMYFVGSTNNSKKGLAGLTLKAGGLLPLGSTFTAQKNFDKAIETILKKRCIGHIYPEQSLWVQYKKIRPFKNGAFHYAVKYNVPVVPIVLLFRPLSKLDKLVHRKVKVTIEILPPVYPDKSLGAKERLLKLLEEVRKAMVDCANEFYGVESDAVKVYEEKSKSESA